ncbi:TPA: DUF3373 domain-containing protein, partial [Campylobacter jejuni]
AHMTDFALPFPETNLPIGPSGTLVNVLQDGVYNLGNLTLANIHFENYNAFGTNFNYFVSLGYSNGANAHTLHPNPAVQSLFEFNEKDG